VTESIVVEVKRLVGKSGRVLVILDSNHVHEHVFQELQLYFPTVRGGRLARGTRYDHRRLAG
jgi:cephalosporin hydroxylase